MDAWHFDFVDDESNALALEQLQVSEALLMGRRTYEIYASAWPGRDGEYADLINAMPKYVASTTLEHADWANTTILREDLVDQVTKLKEQTGDILMHGFGPVARTLLTAGLLDELFLWVHPVLAGVGEPGADLLWHEGISGRLTLQRTRALASGVVTLSYRAN
jgi:dihydrofolate reductase